MRLINADDFIKEIFNRCEAAIKWGINAIADHNEEIKIRAEQAIATFCEASLTAKKMPTIEAEPVKHGKWIWEECVYKCSNCSHKAYGNILECMDGTYKYCPNCGARMEIKDDCDKRC